MGKSLCQSRVKEEKMGDKLFRCEECKEDTANILVDERDKGGLEFCSWECLMEYAIKKHNREQPTTMGQHNTSIKS